MYKLVSNINGSYIHGSFYPGRDPQTLAMLKRIGSWIPEQSKTDYNADHCGAYNYILDSFYRADNETGLFRKVFEEPIRSPIRGCAHLKTYFSSKMPNGKRNGRRGRLNSK